MTCRRRFSPWSVLVFAVIFDPCLDRTHSDSGSRFSYPSNGDGYENANWSVIVNVRMLGYFVTLLWNLRG
jgi:hypothetical protein